MPEEGNSACEPVRGENCRTSGDCTCFSGQSCDPKNPKAGPSGCVSPNDIACPTGATRYGTGCYCKSGFEMNADKTMCVKKSEQTESGVCTALSMCPGAGEKYCEEGKVKYWSCSQKICTENIAEDCYAGGGSCSNGKCTPQKSSCIGGKPDSNCDTARGENCATCRPDCECYDLECQPGKVGAISIGCFNPCLDVYYSLYDKASGACKCQEGYEWNNGHTNCEPITCPENTHQVGFMCVCDDGYMDCNGKRDDGCETAVSRDPVNCGKCKVSCVRDSTCEDSNCICDEGYVLDKTKNACVLFKCNNNKECEPSLGEECNDCKDCACDKKSVCDGPLKLYPDITNEKGCRDCDGYCKAKYGDHAILKKVEPTACLCDCEGGYVFSDDLKSCVEDEKKAVIFISDDPKFGVSEYERWWIALKLKQIYDFYTSKGYRVYYKKVSDVKDITDELIKNPSTKAMAYFGHGMEPGPGETKYSVPPTIEGQPASNLTLSGFNSAINYYMHQGMNVTEANQKAQERLSGDSFNLDYAYLNICYSMNDDSLANSFIKPQGLAWGGKGQVSALQSLTPYTKNVAQQDRPGVAP